MEHASNTSRVSRVIIPCGESCCLALHILELLDLLSLVRVPYCGGILKDRSNQCSVCLSLDLLWATP